MRNLQGRYRWRLGALFASLVLVLTSVVMASAGPVGTASGFEDDDGNLAPEAPINFDWNSFAPTTWTGTAPYRESDKVVSGWTFKGIEDARVTTSDTAFAGGTKQDNDCPVVNTGKAPNKDDLERIYLSTKNVGGDTFLNLAWVRIPQNTTSPSAHIGFEFNKGTSGPCPASSDGLVKRTAGDMLIVYDFEGGSTNAPTITLRRWVTSGACEVGSSTAPCWGPATNLTALGFAEAKVNTFGSVADAIGPTAETLGTNEFGEAGINLTDAGVFDAGSCESFGKAFGVSRSSGNSGTAQMKDLVGPADFTIANCGTVIIRKVTDPAGDTTTDFGYTTNVTTTPATTTSPFSLKDGESETIENVNPGSNLNVTEDDPGPNYELTSIDCTASSVPSANISTDADTTRAVTFSIAAGETLDCTFTNTLQQGAIEITKTRKHAADGSGDHPHEGVGFEIDGESVGMTDASGTICVDGLDFGTYDVTEIVPDGYVADGLTTKSVTVDNNATCSDMPYVGETVSFANTPLTDITVSVNSQVDGGTASTIDCVDSNDDSVASGSTGANGDGSATASDLLPGTYVCTVVVDP